MKLWFTFFAFSALSVPINNNNNNKILELEYVVCSIFRKQVQNLIFKNKNNIRNVFFLNVKF